MILLATTNVDLDQRVERDLIGMQADPLHLLEQVIGLVQQLFDGATFQKRVESHFIWSDERLLLA